MAIKITPSNTKHEPGCFSDHIVILGWSERVTRIIAQLRDDVHRGSNDIRPILVITDESVDTLSAGENFEKVYFLHGHPSSTEVLERADLHQARALLIPSPSLQSKQTDGNAVFSMLAALSLRPDLRVCVEITSPDNENVIHIAKRSHIIGGDVEVVSLESVCEQLMAQTAINKGITRIYSHLLDFSEVTNELYGATLSPTLSGKTFRELSHLGFDAGAILLGYERDGEVVLNPLDRNITLNSPDQVWWMSYNKRDGLLIYSPESLI
jgi:Trk K+ transport system NAD-binding subunit